MLQRILRGLAIAGLLLLILFAGGIWYARTNMGPLATRLIQEQAKKSIRGRLDFKSLRIDSLGRAELTEVAITPEGGKEPLITAPRLTASLDLLTLFGVNRGARTIVLKLDKAHFTILRDMEGKLALASLFKQQPPKKSDWGIAVRLQNAQVSFTDLCLVDRPYPQLPAQNKLVESLLLEAGYDRRGPAEAEIFEAQLELSGSLDYNPGRLEMRADLRAELEGGAQLGAEGRGAADGSSYKMSLHAQKLPLKLIRSYLASLFPKLQIEDPSLGSRPARPSLNGSIDDLTLDLAKQPGQAQTVGGSIQLADLDYRSARLPELNFPQLHLAYDAGTEKLSSDIELNALGAQLSGKPVVGLKDHSLSGHITLAAKSIGPLTAQAGVKAFPISGGIRASADLGGSLDAAQIELKGSSELLKFDNGKSRQFKLGKLALEASLSPQAVTIRKAHFSGGELPFDVSGALDFADGGLLQLDAGPLAAGSLLSLLRELSAAAGESAQSLSALSDAAGKLSLSASLDIPAEALKAHQGSQTGIPGLAGTASLSSSSLSLTLGSGAQLKLGKADVSGSFSQTRFKIDKAAFSGGELPLKASGNYVFASRNGAFSLSAGPLEISDALALGRQLTAQKGQKTPALPKAISEAQGKITAGAELKIAAGKANGSLSLGSDKLSIAGNTISGLVAAGSIKGQTLLLDSAEGKLVLAEPLELAGFSSKGPLALGLRVGGSISLPAANGKGGSLNLSGKAATSNLSPQQANLSYKLGGDLASPDVKLQIKTDAQENPLLLSLSGTLKQGDSPLTASLSWYGSQADYSGSVNLDKQSLDGKLTADKLEIVRFSPDKNLGGSLSLNATLSGKLAALSATGRASLPRLSYKMPQRSYDVTDASFGFKLSQTAAAKGSPAEGALAISEGKFKFEGNSFSASGILGRGEKKITLACDSFNLFSALALIPEKPAAAGKSAAGKPPLDIRSSGPLTISIGGELDDPRFSASYTSGAGAVAGHAFDSAALRASGSLKRVDVESFSVKSKDGSISASASLQFAAAAPSGRAQQRASAQPSRWLAGLVNSAYAAVAGDATEVGGSANSPAASEGKPVQRSEEPLLALPADDEQVVVSNEASSTEALNGTRSKAAAMPSGIASWQASISLDSFDAAVLTPLTGVPALSALRGRIDGTALLSGGAQQFSADGKLSLSGGSYNEVPITSASAQFRSKGKGVEIQSASLTNEQTSLSLSGNIGPEPKDLAIKARADRLDLALAAPLLPKDAPKLAGVISADLNLKPGKGAYPDLDLSLQDTGSGLKIGPASFSSASADLTIRNDQLDISKLNLQSGASSLTAGGKLAPSLLTPGPDGKGNARLPLDFWVKAERFALADLKPLLPKPAAGEKPLPLPDGVVSCDLTVGGRLDAPQLSGPVSFTLASLPLELPLGINGLSGEIQLTKNSFDIVKMSVSSGSDAQLAQMAISGSGGLKFNPFGLTPSSSIDINLSPQGNYYEAKKGGDLPFEGSIGGRLIVSGVADKNAQQAWQLSGDLSVTEPGGKSIYTYRPPGKDAKQQASPVRLKNLKLLLNAGTEFRLSPGGAAAKFSDLKAEVQGQLTLNGVPGVEKGADALSIDGTLALVSGSMRVYRHIVRLEGSGNKIVFPKKGDSGQGPVAPLLTARGVLTLERALSGTDIPASTISGGQLSGGRSNPADLMIRISLQDANLATPEQVLDKMKLSSDPPLSEEKILLYLLGGADKVLLGEEDLSQFAEGELVAFGSTFISRAIERSFDLERFSLGGSGDENNPYYVDVEKAVSPDVSFTYFKNFYSQTNQQEQYGMRYKLLEGQQGGKYRNLNLEVNFDKNNNGRQGAEFMFNWTTSF